MSIEDTINYIDGQIGSILTQIINARTKHLDAISKILDKLKAIQNVSLNYRLGTTLEKMVKVETGQLTHFDITKPRFQLSYTGNKMTMQYNGRTIEVPSVPIFIYDPSGIPNNIHEIGREMLSANLKIAFPVDTEFAEAPDLENAYTKYYELEEVAPALGAGATVEFPETKYIPLPDPVLSLTSFEVDEGYTYSRVLHQNSNSYTFSISAYYGRSHGDVETIGGKLATDVKLDSILFICTTDYEGDVRFCIFNNRYMKGPFIDLMYQRWVLLISFQQHMMMASIE